MFLMDLLMQISRVSITEYRGYFYRINEQGAMLKPFKPSYMDEIKSWELACRLVEKEFPSQKGVYSILAVSGMLAAGKMRACPVLNGKNTGRRSHSAAVLSRKDLLLPEQKRSCRRAIG